jgi:aminopeptidase N
MRFVFITVFLLGLNPLLFAQNTENAPACLKKIEKYTNDFEFHKALDACDKCIQKNERSARLYYLRGLVNLYLNHRDDAARDFQRAISSGIAKEGGFEDEEFIRWYSDTTFIIQNSVDSLIFPKLKPELGYREPYTKADTLQGMLRPERTCFDVIFENLTVKVIPETKTIEGNNKITFKALRSSNQIQLDLFDNYQVLDITHEQKSLAYSRVKNAIFVTFDEPLEKGEIYTVTVHYKGTPIEAPNPPWDGGFVWKKNGDRHFIGVACEHLGASSWWPNKDHLTDKPDSMDINILAPSGYDVVANGNLLNHTQGEDGYDKFHWHVSYPINNYNVTFYIGDFMNFKESYLNTHNQKVDLDYYVLEQNLDTAKNYYSGTKRIVSVFEQLFGDYAFPKDGLGFVESPFEGMEHQGAIAIGGEYSHDSLHYPIVGDYPLLVVHETAHEWWGNAVAVSDMADIWISEGFATYAEHLFLEREFGVEKYIESVGDNMINIINIWPMVGNRNVNDNAFLGQDVYSKGAAMLHSLRCIFDDDEAFFNMIKDFYSKSSLKTCTTEDFTSHARRYTSKRLTGFFNVFLYQKRPPTLEYSYKHKGSKLQIIYRWTGVPDDFEMPFLLAFDDGISFRMDATTTYKVENFVHVKNFYLFNPIAMNPTLDTKNAFTYYFAKLKPYKKH